MAASAINSNRKGLGHTPGQIIPHPISSCQVEDDKLFHQELIEEFIGGVLVFTEQQQLIYANEGARKILSHLQQKNDSSSLIPDEIWHICQSLIQSRHLFPDQNWLMEFDIFTNFSTSIHVCSRWLNALEIEAPCLLLTLEDRQQALINLVIEEADRFGLTPREKEVWLLQHNGYTYKQIAAELGITPNTVKKHMRSIHAKRRADQDEF